MIYIYDDSIILKMYTFNLFITIVLTVHFILVYTTLLSIYLPPIQ